MFPDWLPAPDISKQSVDLADVAVAGLALALAVLNFLYSRRLERRRRQEKQADDFEIDVAADFRSDLRELDDRAVVIKMCALTKDRATKAREIRTDKQRILYRLDVDIEAARQWSNDESEKIDTVRGQAETAIDAFCGTPRNDSDASWERGASKAADNIANLKTLSLDWLRTVKSDLSSGRLRPPGARAGRGG